MRDGYVIIFSQWKPDSAGTSVSGLADILDANRLFKERKSVTLRVDSVAIFETHVIRYARLLAVPRPVGGHVFYAGNGEF